MTRRAITLALVLSAVSLFLPVKYALACSCVPPPPDAVAAEEADVVFSGEVTATHDPHGDDKIVSSGRTVTYTFEVDGVVKGEVGNKERVKTAADSASCGYGFKTGRRYLVFADEGKSGALSTHSCSNTHPLGANEDVGLGAEPPPAPDAGGPAEPDSGDRPRSDGGVPMTAVVGTGIVVLLGGAALFLSRRRTA